MPHTQKQTQQAFVDSIRQATPYIQAHRGSTMVLTFGGEAVGELRVIGEIVAVIG